MFIIYENETNLEVTKFVCDTIEEACVFCGISKRTYYRKRSLNSSKVVLNGLTIEYLNMEVE